MRRLTAVACTALLGACCAAGARAGDAAGANQPLVPDAMIRTIDGGTTRLSDLWRQQPLLVTFFYTRCAGVCIPYLRSLAQIADAQGGAGQTYRILALSFDPEDGVEQVNAHVRGIGLAGKRGWLFGVTDPGSISLLAAAFDFWFRLDADRRRYDHPAMMGLVVDGRIVRVLRGNPVNPRAFRELNWELRGSYVPSYSLPGRDTLASCLQYDPATGRARPDWGMLLLVLPAFVAVAVSGFIFSRRGSLLKHGC